MLRAFGLGGGIGFGAWCLGLRARRLLHYVGFRAWGFGAQGLGFGAQGLKFQGSGTRDLGFAFTGQKLRSIFGGA